MDKKLAAAVLFTIGVASVAMAQTSRASDQLWIARSSQQDPLSDVGTTLVVRAPFALDASGLATGLFAQPPLVLTMPLKRPKNVRWEEPPSGLQVWLGAVGNFIADATRPAGVGGSPTAADAVTSPVLLTFLVVVIGAVTAKIRHYSS